MSVKKKKPKQKRFRQVSPVEMIAHAEEQLRLGNIDEAIRHLLEAETQLKPSVSVDGKKISTPPHLIAARTSLPSLLARAFASRSLTSLSTDRKLADLKQAVGYAPGEARYRNALGACQIAYGDPDLARGEFEKAIEVDPGNQTAMRGRLLALQAKNPTGDLQAIGSADALREGLEHLARGEREQAQATLSALPAFDRNPSRIDASRLATQFYYNGAISFSAGNDEAAFNEWREAGRLIESHHLVLPWIDRLAGGFHKIAERCWRVSLLQAANCWNEALKLRPGDAVAKGNLARIKDSRASQAWANGNIHVAIELWKEAANIDPSDERTLNRLAVAYEKLDDKSSALARWRALARLWRGQAAQRRDEPGFRDRLLKLEERIVRLMTETGAESHEVIEELEAILRFDPENFEIQKQVVEQMLENGKAQSALKRLEIIEQKHGVSPELLTLRARANDQLKRYAPAYNNLEKALSMDPVNGATRRAMLVFLEEDAMRAAERGDRKRATEIIDRALALDASHEPALLLRASLYLHAKDKLKAQELLARVISADPQHPQKHAMVGSVYLRHDMHKEAEAAFKQALKLQPDAECYMNIGLIHLEFEVTKKAIKYFDKAAATATAEQCLVMAVALLENEEPKAAGRYLDLAMKQDPAHPVPHLIKAVLQISNPLLLLTSRNGLETALQELREAERLAAANPAYAGLLPEIRDMRESISDPPPEIAALLGGGLPPFFFDDDDEEGEDFPPLFVNRRKKRKRK
jgi:tetratricopeptide (TPR) repeat protein